MTRRNRDMIALGLGLAFLGACGTTDGSGPAADPADGPATAPPDGEAAWRVYEVKTRVEVPAPTGVTRAWIPVPRSADTDHQRAEAPTWQGNAVVVEHVVDPLTGVEMVYAEWPETELAPLLTVTTLVETRDRAVDLFGPHGVEPLTEPDRALYTSASALIPIDGIVYDTAVAAAGDAVGDVARARALYDWIVDNSYRDPEPEGCGTGDIATMLETGDLGGKCVDINALFVGMARSLGIAARHDYGIRVDHSVTYGSLGAPGDITKSQHCRAEFWAEGLGWVPVDPADVRKLMLEEDGGLAADDPLVVQAREAFFGTAEMNWVVYNHGEDVALPDSSAGSLPFLMYPQVESGGVLCDCYVQDTCSYRIESTPL